MGKRERGEREVARRLGWGERGMGSMSWRLEEGDREGIAAAAWTREGIEAMAALRSADGAVEREAHLRWTVEEGIARPAAFRVGGREAGEERALAEFAELIGRAPREPIFLELQEGSAPRRRGP